MASSSAVTLDDLASTPTDLDSHLSFPSFPALHDQADEEEGLPNPVGHHRQTLKDRLYIGNLHPSVDEYSLLQVFSKFGKVTKLDFLFHKTGLLKGKPRGYAFVEYANEDDALKALTVAHDKLLRGRKLVVTFAHQAPLDQYGGIGFPSSMKSRKTMMETGRPTTLSMIKSTSSNRHEGKTEDKIALMEAKLRQMECANPIPKDSQSPGHSSKTYSSAPPNLPHHPSLPMKPPLTLPKLVTPHRSPSSAMLKTTTSTSSLQPLPLFSSHTSVPVTESNAKPPAPTTISKAIPNLTMPRPSLQPRSAKSTKLVGVKIKAKNKNPDTS